MKLLSLAGGTFADYFQFSEVDWSKVWNATYETIYMSAASIIAIFLLGLVLGLLLFETRVSEHAGIQALHKVVSGIVNIFRSIPFIILIVLLIPLTQILVGRMTGPTAALPALIISSGPFYARIIEAGFRDVDKGVIEAAEAMGASKWEVIYKVLIPESSPSIVAGLTTTAIAVVGFTAMAGVIGAGGLGSLAYLQGFQRNKHSVTLVATLIILAIVFVVQALGDWAVKTLDKR
ncbi:methionine ABC transporter permease [Dolosigranulum pigrum]|uniref:methionine ABC transporter permease n=1 Tax=Dolosigranulum pigrum TaxID=29394 RepID=UPI000DBFB2EA|nr:methionine ABC transporter permease [Dolosigranulum pigrum]RAN52229.1 methionine ABC transporter permease [Dolosigranulum pigrum]